MIRRGRRPEVDEHSPPSDDSDPAETLDWLESLEVCDTSGRPSRSKYLLQQLEARAQELGIRTLQPPYSAYRNTIPLEHQAAIPAMWRLEERITAILRWNALAMVVRANRLTASSAVTSPAMPRPPRSSRSASIISFAPTATVDDGDLVFFQPHSAPGVYARAFWKAV